jgi:hypothetical protein
MTYFGQFADDPYYRTAEEEAADEQYWAEIAQHEQYLAAGLPLHTTKDTNMKMNDMIESKYLKQGDVEGEIPVTVAGLKKVNVARDDEEPEYRWTVKFDEFPKPMVINSTNLKRMFKALGDDTDDWLGGKIMLYVDHDVEYAGNIVGGLRVRAIKSKASVKPKPSDDELNAKLAAVADDDSVPF